MDSFSVTSDLTQQDWAAQMHAVRMRMTERMRQGSWLIRWAPLLGAAAAVAAMVLTEYLWPSAFQIESLLLGLVAMLAYMAFLASHARKQQAPAEDGSYLGRVELGFSPEGISISRARSSGHASWSLVRDISYTPAHVFLWIDHLTAYVFRVADLPAPLGVDEAVARLRALKAGAGTAHALAPPEGAASVVSDSAVAAAVAVANEVLPQKPSTWQEIRALGRLELMRVADPAHLFGRDTTILLLGAIALTLWIGLDRLNYGAGAEFMWFGVASVGVSVCIALSFSWVMSRLSSPVLPMRRTTLLVATVSPIVVVFAWLMGHVGRTMYYIALAVLASWLAMFLQAGLRAMTGLRQWRALGATATSFLVLVYFSAWLFPGGTSTWYVPDTDYEADFASAAAREQLQFDQAPRIDAAVAKLPAGDPARAAMYFVGFAGYGEQRVFAEEIATAARVVGEKYSLRGRELRLVNDRRDEATWPVASVTALRHALLGLGQRMNRENDVLFLALSSHGDVDASLSVVNDSMSIWRDLNAAELRSMLDESGIRWRVIVISACHAGSFIESLRDENTIILTAAAKENTSFGCSDDRDLTYFGEAFYRDALPGAASLREAFEQARVAIAAREKSEGIEASDPQADFGTALEAKLGELSSVPVASAQGR